MRVLVVYGRHKGEEYPVKVGERLRARFEGDGGVSFYMVQKRFSPDLPRKKETYCRAVQRAEMKSVVSRAKSDVVVDLHSTGAETAAVWSFPRNFPRKQAVTIGTSKRGIHIIRKIASYWKTHQAMRQTIPVDILTLPVGALESRARFPPVISFEFHVRPDIKPSEDACILNAVENVINILRQTTKAQIRRVMCELCGHRRATMVSPIGYIGFCDACYNKATKRVKIGSVPLCEKIWLAA